MSLAVLLVTSLLGGFLPVQKKPPEPPPLLSESGAATSLRDGVLRMRKSGGWVRTRQLVSDFVLAVDVNLETRDTDATIGIRTLHTQEEWPARGHSIALSARSPAGEPRSGPAWGRGGKEDDPRALAPGVWHSVRIPARGASVTVEIGGTAIGTHQIDITTGAIAVLVSSGAARFATSRFGHLG